MKINESILLRVKRVFWWLSLKITIIDERCHYCTGLTLEPVISYNDSSLNSRKADNCFEERSSYKTDI